MFSRLLFSAALAVLCLVSVPESASARHVPRHRAPVRRARAFDREVQLLEVLEQVQDLEARVNHLVAGLNVEPEPVNEIAGFDSADSADSDDMAEADLAGPLKNWYNKCRDKTGMNLCIASAGASAGLACVLALPATVAITTVAAPVTLPLACGGAIGIGVITAAGCIHSKCR